MNKIIAVLITLSLALSLAACGGNDVPAATPGDLAPEPGTVVADLNEISIGDTITLDFVEMTIDEAGFADEISITFNDRKTTTSSGREQAGMQYVYISGTIKNVSTSPLQAGFIGNVKIDGYTYEISAMDHLIARDGGTGSSLDPLAVYTYKLFSAVPNELVEDYQSITVNFGFNDLFDNSNYDNYAFENRDYQYSVAFEEMAPSTMPDAEETAASTSSSGREGRLWEKSFYVDDFNQPTDEAYITNNSLLTGTFSNSATTNSKLTGHIMVDEEHIAIMLYEYGRTTVKNSSTRYDEAYDIKMKKADGTIIDLTGAMWTGGDRIIIDDQYKSQVLDALSDLPVDDIAFVSFSIVQTDRPTTNYLLMAPMSNFGDVIDTLYE